MKACFVLCAFFIFSFGVRSPTQDQINSRVDLVLRMADEKWRLAQHAYDRLDVNIRRLDADLGRMEVPNALLDPESSQVSDIYNIYSTPL